MMYPNCRTGCTDRSDHNDSIFVKMNECATEEDTPLFVSAHRWREFLLTHSCAFRNLVEEQQAGWRSAALDAWYAQRRKEDAERVRQTCTEEPEKTNGIIVNSCTDNIREVVSRNVNNNKRNTDDKYFCFTSSSSVTTERPTSTIFTNVNMTKLSERYRSHIRKLFDSTFATRRFFCVNNNEKNIVSTKKKEKQEEKCNSDCQVDKLKRNIAIFKNSSTIKEHQRQEEQHSMRSQEEEKVEQEWQTKNSKYTFLDLGCAPGGVSKYLIKDLNWSGVGLTLSPEDGGVELDGELFTPELASSFTLLTGSVVEPTNTWKLVKMQTSATDSDTQMCQLNKAERNRSEWDDKEAKEELLLLPNGKFYFVNGGAVQDYGQRTEITVNKTLNKNGKECKRARSETDEQLFTTKGKMCNCNADKIMERCKHNLTNSINNTCLHDEKAILPWLTLLVPQLSLALEHVCPFGAFMLLHGYPSCASLFILLRVLKNIVHAHFNSDTNKCDNVRISNNSNKSANGITAGAHNSAISKRLECEQHVHIFETIHLAKAPVYILWDNVHVQGKEREISRLLNALDLSSSVINPLEVNAFVSDNLSNESAEHASLMERKQKFWLGESDDGFNLAKEGFHLYRHDLERVWQRAAEFLRARRLRAEHAMKKISQATYKK